MVTARSKSEHKVTTQYHMVHNRIKSVGVKRFVSMNCITFKTVDGSNVTSHIKRYLMSIFIN